MSVFVNHTSLFIGNTNPKEKKFEKDLMAAAIKSGISRFIEPCSGELAMCQLAKSVGYKDMEASDITLFSTVLGYYVEGKSEKDYEKLNIQIKGIGRVCEPVEVLYWLMYFRVLKNAGKKYFDSIIYDIETRKEWHKEKIKETLDRAREEFKDVKYYPLDMIDHLRQVLDDEKALVVMNFPTYKGGYEKFFDVGDNITWNEPSYAIFDPRTDKPAVKEILKNAKCLVLFYEEAYAGETEFDPVYVRFGCREGMNTYITTNDLERVEKLLGRKYAVRPDERDIEPLKCDILNRDFVFDDTVDVKVVEITPKQSNYYRLLLTHNFVGSGSSGGFAILVNDKVFGVFGFDKTFSGLFGDGSNTEIFLMYGMAFPVKGFRTNRLITLVASLRSVVNAVCNDIEKETFKFVKTTMISKYPESKQMRGLMKLERKSYEKKENMYKLVYKREIENRTIKEAYLEWLKREKEYKELQKK